MTTGINLTKKQIADLIVSAENVRVRDPDDGYYFARWTKIRYIREDSILLAELSSREYIFSQKEHTTETFKRVWWTLWLCKKVITETKTDYTYVTTPTLEISFKDSSKAFSIDYKEKT